MGKEIVFTKQAPEPVGPYSQAIKAGEFIFLSGQIPIDAASGEIETGDIQKQTRMAMNNIKAVVGAAGFTLGNIVKTTLFITDMKKFPLINEIYQEYFPQNQPARSCVEVSALPKGVGIEIEAVVFSG